MAMEKILTSAVGVPESWTIGSYEKRGGYASLRKALQMAPAAIIDEVKKSNLRGRGGAGFPTGVKWGFLPRESNVPKYLVINADEGEPGTFKDHLLMELDPHRLVEGCIITGWALGMRACYVFIRGEMFQEAHRVQRAIDEAYRAKLLGENILGSGLTYDMYVHMGAGAYICGEETALIEALEGKAGQPRMKPPFPAVVGLFSCPTIVNNVETIAAVPTIIERGGEWWAEQGCERNGGPKMYGVSGHVRRPGVFEASHGVTLEELIFSDEFAGGPRLGKDGKPKKIKGVIPGGASCPVLTPEELGVRMDFDSMMSHGAASASKRPEWVDEQLWTDSLSWPGGRPRGTMLGTGCALVMDEDVCMVRVAANLAHFYHHESCGQCTPCREGSGWTARVLDSIEAGTGTERDVELLLEICNNMEGNTICPFGDAVAMAVRSYVLKYPEEFYLHVKQGGCPYPHW